MPPVFSASMPTSPTRMVLSLSVIHLTNLLIVLLASSPAPIDAAAHLQLPSGTLSLRQTRAIKISDAPTTTTTTTTTTTRSPSTSGRLLIRLADESGITSAINKTTSAAANSTTPVPHVTTINRKYLTEQLGYTELGSSGPASAENPEAEGSKRSLAARYRLPSWFNFERYKRFYGKHYRTSREDEVHRRIYLRTALKVFEQRAHYRAGRSATLASINELSDLTSEELEAFKHGTRRPHRRKLGLLASEPAASPAPSELQCCTYEQVYSRIIELLNATSSSGSEGNLVLSRALIEELEQKSLVQADENELPTASDDDHDDGAGDGALIDGIIASSSNDRRAFEGLMRPPEAAGDSRRPPQRARLKLSGQAGPTASELPLQQLKAEPIRNLIGGPASDERRTAMTPPPLPTAPGKLIEAQQPAAEPSRRPNVSGRPARLLERPDNGTLLARLGEQPPKSLMGAPQPVLAANRHTNRQPKLQQQQAQRHQPPQPHRKQSALMGSNEPEEIGRPSGAQNRQTSSARPQLLPRPAHKSTGSGAASSGPLAKTAGEGSSQSAERRDGALVAGPNREGFAGHPKGQAATIQDAAGLVVAAREREPQTAAAIATERRDGSAGATGDDSSGRDRSLVTEPAPDKREEEPFEEPELSATERAIAESVRRQVEQQLSGNSTIARQLADKFSAYFGEPVLVRASVDEAEVRRALVKARGTARQPEAAPGLISGGHQVGETTTSPPI